MAFYDASAQKQTLSPLQQALLLPPTAILQHQELLTSICKQANFSDEKAEYILDILLSNIQESLTYNNPSQSRTSLIILDFCIRNGTIFGQYVFGRYILQKLYSFCCRDLSVVESNHSQHQEFQYQLIGTMLEWHRMYSNQASSTLNYTFSRLQKSGILALYQSYKQTQNLFNNANNANSQQLISPNKASTNLPNLPPSPQPKVYKNDIDEKQAAQQFPSLEVRGRAMTTSSSKQSMQESIESRPRSQSASDAIKKEKEKEKEKEENGINVEVLIHRDGRIKLEYTEKFQNEVNVLITRYLKPTREILSRQKINLADKKLQKFLQILQTIQQRLVRVISEVKNDESVVSLAIKSNDCIVATILWFNSLVKKSKNTKNKNESVRADKGESVSKNVMENIDLVGLEQQLLLDIASLFKKKQLRDLKNMEKEKEKKEKEDGSITTDINNNKQNEPQQQPVQVINDENDEQNKDDKDVNDNVINDIISEPVPVSIPQQKQEKQEEEQQQQSQVVDTNNNVQQSGFSSFSSIALNSTSQINVNNNNNNNDDVVDLLNMNVNDMTQIVIDENGNDDNNDNNNDDEIKQEAVVINDNNMDKTNEQEMSDNDDDAVNDNDNNNNDDNDVIATMSTQIQQPTDDDDNNNDNNSNLNRL